MTIIQGGIHEESNIDVNASESILPQCKGAFTWADLRSLLPEECRKAFIEGMGQFGRQIKGFDREDCILSGVESRTSSPVRILRDENFSSKIQEGFSRVVKGQVMQEGSLPRRWMDCVLGKKY